MVKRRVTICYLPVALLVGLLSCQVAADDAVQAGSAVEAALPRPPSDFAYPTELARSGAVTMVRPHVAFTLPPDAKRQQPLRIPITVRRSLLGETPIGKRIDVVVDPAKPPDMRLDRRKPNADTGHDLLVLDANARLLAAITETWEDGQSFPSAIGTARCPSRRYSQRELEWAWWAFRTDAIDRRQSWLRLRETDYAGKFFPAPGWMELILRFDNYDMKLDLLRAMRRRRLSSAEIDVAEIALFDVVPEIQGEAAHVLLDHGRRVDPKPLLATLENDDGYQRPLAVVGPLLRLRHPRARSALIAFLTDKQYDEGTDRQPWWFRIRDNSVYEEPEVPKYLLAPALQRLRSDEFAWLSERVPADDLKEVVGALCSSRVVDFEPAAVWEHLSEAMQEENSKRLPRPLVEDHWAEVDRLLTTRLEGPARQRAVAAVRGWLSKVRADDPHSRLHLLGALLALGEDTMEELRRMVAENDEGPFDIRRDIGPQTLTFVAGCAAPIRGPRALDLMLRSLKRANAGWQHDDTGAGSWAVAVITNLIHARGEADRATALAQWKQWRMNAKNWQSQDQEILWALGERPTKDQLLAPPPRSQRMPLVEWDPRDYRDILPALRAQPLEHCTALAALRDASSAEAIASGILQLVRDARNVDPKGPDLDYGRFRAARVALEQLHNADATEPLYQAIEMIRPIYAEELALTLGRCEGPKGLPRLIRLVQRSGAIAADDPGRSDQLRRDAALAILFALGSKP